MIEFVKKNKKIILNSSIFIGINNNIFCDKICGKSKGKGYSGKNKIEDNKTTLNNSQNLEQNPQKDNPQKDNPPINPIDNNEKPIKTEDIYKDLRRQLIVDLERIIKNNDLLGSKKFKIEIKEEDIKNASKDRLDEIKLKLEELDKNIIDELNKDKKNTEASLKNKSYHVLSLFDDVNNLNNSLSKEKKITLLYDRSVIEKERSIAVLNSYKEYLERIREEILKILEKEEIKKKVNIKYEEVKQLNDSLPEGKKIILSVDLDNIKMFSSNVILLDYLTNLTNDELKIKNIKKEIEEENKKKAEELKKLNEDIKNSNGGEYIKLISSKIDSFTLRSDLKKLVNIYNDYKDDVEKLTKLTEEKGQKEEELKNLKIIEGEINNLETTIKKCFLKYHLNTKEKEKLEQIEKNVAAYNNIVNELKRKYSRTEMDNIRSKYNTERYIDGKILPYYTNYLFSKKNEHLDILFNSIERSVKEIKNIRKDSVPFRYNSDEIKKTVNDANETNDYNHYILEEDLKKIKEKIINYLNTEKNKIKGKTNPFYFCSYGTNFYVYDYICIEDCGEKDFCDYFYDFITKEETIIQAIHDFFYRECIFELEEGFYNKTTDEMKEPVENVFPKIRKGDILSEDDWNVLNNSSKGVKNGEDFINIIRQYFEDGKFINKKKEEYEKDYKELKTKHDSIVYYNKGSLKLYNLTEVQDDVKKINENTEKMNDLKERNKDLGEKISKLNIEIGNLNFSIKNIEDKKLKEEYNTLINTINTKYKDDEEFKKIKDEFNDKVKPIS